MIAAENWPRDTKLATSERDLGRHRRQGNRERVIGMYEVHIRRRPDLLAALPELVGKRLGCYCKPEACHGDVLVKLLRELFLEV